MRRKWVRGGNGRNVKQRVVVPLIGPERRGGEGSGREAVDSE